MDVLNKIINQNYDIKLSDENVYEIVSYYYMLPDYPQKASYLRTVREALQNRIIDPDIFLAACIAEVEMEEDAFLVALALRCGANPNLYLVFEDMGIIHLMGYTMLLLREKINPEVLNFVLSIESLMGSSFASPLTKNSGRSIDNKIVGEYLDSQGYYDFSDPVDFVKKLPEEDQVSIGLMCDIPEIAFPFGVPGEFFTEVFNEDGTVEIKNENLNPTEPDLLSLIMYQSFECAKFTSIPMTIENGENNELRICLSTGALEIFKMLFERGFIFNYFSMNRLLLLLRGTFRTNEEGRSIVTDQILNQIYYDILKYVINRGVRVDRDQFNIIDTINKKYSNEVANLYNKPLWVKACSGSPNVPLPDMVKTLAYSLNIDASKDKMGICADLDLVAGESPENLKSAAITRQKNRIAAEIHGPLDYARGNTNIHCRNASSIDGNPFEYNDISLAHYIDGSGNLWCFVAPDFENLVKEPMNPQTGEPLPRAVVNKMMDSLEFFERTGISASRIVTAGEAAKALRVSDTISNVNSDRINSTIINLAQIRGIYPKYLRNLDANSIQDILGLVYMQQDYLYELTHTHQFSTMCRALYATYKQDMELFEYALNEIKKILKDVY